MSDLPEKKKTLQQLAKTTPTTEELLTEEIDGVVYTYKFHKSCRVCNSLGSIRSTVDTLLLTPKTYLEVLKTVRLLEEELNIPEEGKLTNESLRIHARQHLPTDKKEVREIVERRARKRGLRVLNGTEDILTAEAVLETVVKKGFEDLVEGNVRPTLNQTMHAMEMLGKIEQLQSSQYTPEVLLSQLNTIMLAVKEVVPPEMLEKILNKIDEYANTAKELAEQTDDYVDLDENLE